MFTEQTKPYLNHKQESELLEDQARLQKMLSPNAPAHIRNQIQDTPEMSRQLRAVTQQLQDDAPKPYGKDDLDAAIKRAAKLKEQWLGGMPTQSEMRRNPPGAVDKHTLWEDRNKKAILEWKNIQRRLHASEVDVGGERSCANMETQRPYGGPGEMNLAGGQINPPAYHIPPTVEIRNVMSDEDKVARGITPDDMNVVLKQLEEVQKQLDALQKPKKPKRVWTPEQRKAAGDRLRLAREAKDPAEQRVEG